MGRNNTKIFVDGVALSDKQTGAVRVLASVGYYTCVIGVLYAAGKIEDKIYDWKKTRQQKKLLKEEQKKEQAENA